MDPHFLSQWASLPLLLKSGWFGLSTPWSFTLVFSCWNTEIPANGRVIPHAVAAMYSFPHVTGLLNNSGNWDGEGVKYADFAILTMLMIQNAASQNLTGLRQQIIR